MFTTLAEAKASSLAEIAGSCNNSEAFLLHLNEAEERLLYRGDWEGTVVPISVAVRSGWVVWPRFVAEVRKIKWGCCGASPMHTRSMWYRFLERSYTEKYGWSNSTLTHYSRACTYNEISGEGRYLRVYVSAAADIGKTMTIFGFDNGSQPLRTLNIDGTMTEGIKITFASPFAGTSIFVRGPIRVIKDVTEGNVFLYEYDPVNDLMVDLAVYEPSETNPDYSRTLISGCCDSTRAVDALVKLKHVPILKNNDLVLVNKHAIKQMMMAIQFENSGETAKANEFEARAIRELNVELANATPETDIPITSNPFGGCDFGRNHLRH
jgi:hypothetical protein